MNPRLFKKSIVNDKNKNKRLFKSEYSKEAEAAVPEAYWNRTLRIPLPRVTKPDEVFQQPPHGEMAELVESARLEIE